MLLAVNFRFDRRRDFRVDGCQTFDRSCFLSYLGFFDGDDLAPIGG